MQTTETKVLEKKVTEYIIGIIEDYNHVNHGELDINAKWIPDIGPIPFEFEIKLSGGKLTGILDSKYRQEDIKDPRDNRLIKRVNTFAQIWIKSLEWVANKDITNIPDVSQQKFIDCIQKYLEQNLLDNELLSNFWNKGEGHFYNSKMEVIKNENHN